MMGKKYSEKGIINNIRVTELDTLYKFMINEDNWYRLDNAAKIYPAISGPGGGSVFRIAVQLKEDIDPQLLKDALVSILPRFPTFAVKMRRGLFWYYFEENPMEPPVCLEKAPPCRAIDTAETNGFLFRISYFKKRIALEVFHALTDGSGALAFLKSLAYQYLLLSGVKVMSDGSILENSTLPSVDETEDSFKKYYNRRIKCRWIEAKAYQLQGTRMPREYVKIVHGIIKLNDFLCLVKESKATVTEYVTAIIIYSIYSTQLKKRECSAPVKVSVPINLRNFFPSQALRNFSSYVNVGMPFSNDEYTFEQVLDTVTRTMKLEVQPEKLIEKISANVKAEKNIFMRIVPLIIKNIVLKTAFNAYGESLFTCTLSNLGVVKIPESMEKNIDRFEFLLGPPVLNMENCSISSYKDEMIITFTKRMHETDLERFFFRFLTEKGLDITIETN